MSAAPRRATGIRQRYRQRSSALVSTLELDQLYLLFIRMLFVSLYGCISGEVLFPTLESLSPRLMGATVHCACSPTVQLPTRKLLIQSQRRFDRNGNLEQKNSIYHQLLILLNIDLFLFHPVASQLLVKPSECLFCMTSIPL